MFQIIRTHKNKKQEVIWSGQREKECVHQVLYFADNYGFTPLRIKSPIGHICHGEAKRSLPWLNQVISENWGKQDVTNPIVDPEKTYAIYEIELIFKDCPPYTSPPGISAIDGENGDIYDFVHVGEGWMLFHINGKLPKATKDIEIDCPYCSNMFIISP